MGHRETGKQSPTSGWAVIQLAGRQQSALGTGQHGSSFFCCRLFGFCDNKEGSPVDPAVLHCQRKPGNMMMPVLCTVRKAGALHLTMKEIPYERTVSEFADVKFPDA